MSAVPAEKVNVAKPAASVVTELWLSMPVSALSVTVTLGTAALEADRAATVTVVEFELSDLTDVGRAESESDAAVTVVVVVVVPVVTALPPHPARKNDEIKERAKSL